MRCLPALFLAASVLLAQGTQLVIGTTTKEQAIAMFGKPTSSADYGQMSSLTWSVMLPGKMNITVLLFDANGVLKHQQIIGDPPPLVGGAQPEQQAASSESAPVQPGPKHREFYSASVPDDGPSWFTPINPATVKDAHKAAKGFKKTCEYVFVDDKNWPGQASQGFLTQVLTGVSVKDAAVRFFFRTPFMAVRDAYILADNSYEDISDDVVLADFGGSNVFHIYADASGRNEKFMNAMVGKAQLTTPGDPIKNLVLELGDGTIVKPVARKGDTFSFPMTLLPASTKGFTIICISNRGLSLKLPIQVGELSDKAIL